MKDKQFLVECADLVEQKMPEGYAFVVFAFPTVESGRCLYVSNAERESAIGALKEWLKTQGHKEAWMKHID